MNVKTKNLKKTVAMLGTALGMGMFGNMIPNIGIANGALKVEKQTAGDLEAKQIKVGDYGAIIDKTMQRYMMINDGIPLGRFGYKKDTKKLEKVTDKSIAEVLEHLDIVIIDSKLKNALEQNKAGKLPNSELIKLITPGNYIMNQTDIVRLDKYRKAQGQYSVITAKDFVNSSGEFAKEHIKNAFDIVTKYSMQDYNTNYRDDLAIKMSKIQECNPKNDRIFVYENTMDIYGTRSYFAIETEKYLKLKMNDIKKNQISTEGFFLTSTELYHNANDTRIRGIKIYRINECTDSTYIPDGTKLNQWIVEDVEFTYSKLILQSGYKHAVDEAPISLSKAVPILSQPKRENKVENIEEYNANFIENNGYVDMDGNDIVEVVMD